jgi:SAM-dependent methyltransferase
MTLHDETAPRYEFGANWQKFVSESLTPERLQQARGHLLQRLQRADLAGLSFLDIGCGSGVHSLAALLSGARSIVSFDFDAAAVATTRQLWEQAGRPVHWTIQQGSILDRAFVQTLPLSDIVYAWGSLHHTGAMWDAIDQAVSRLTPDGVFYTALYASEMYVNPGTGVWKRIKQQYNASGPQRRRWLEWWCAWRFHVLPDLVRLRNPLQSLQRLRSGRGMEFWTDIRDWLGGWPMEFAAVPDTLAYLRERHDCRIVNLATGEGCAEYLFCPAGAHNWWQAVLATRPREPLPAAIQPVRGCAWQVAIPQLQADADDARHPRRSRWYLHEDGEPLTVQHATPRHIARYGGGRFRHWEDGVLFSTSDNSDPRSNGRCYELIRMESV